MAKARWINGLCGVLAVWSLHGANASEEVNNTTRAALAGLSQIAETENLGDVITRDEHYPDGSLKQRTTLAKTADRGYVPHGPVMEFHPGGQVKSRGKMALGFPHGKWEFFDARGALTSGQFQAGQKSGQWLTWAVTKKLRLEENYAHGKLHGVRRTYHNNDRLAKESTYVNGLQHGNARSFFENGMLALEDNWINGQLHGVVKKYDKFGVLLVVGEYFMGTPVGKWEWRNLNDEVVRREDLKDGTGTFCTYLLTGDATTEKQADRRIALKEETALKDGKRHGLYKSYYPNGKLQTAVRYENGKRHGDFQEWFPNGQLKGEGRFNAGQLEGVVKEYHLNEEDPDAKLVASKVTTYKSADEAQVREYSEEGKLLTELSLKYEKPDGRFVRFFPSGKKMIEGTFKLGDRTGVWKEYYSSGLLRLTQTYESGRLQGAVEEFYEPERGKKANKKASGNYTNGQREGKWLAWYPDGSLQAEKTYRYGKEDGEYREYWAKENGDGKESSLKVEGRYLLGEKEGEWKVWYASGLLKSRAFFNKGRQHGVAEEFYDFKAKGKQALRVRGEFRFGKQEGTWKAFFKNGKVEYLQTYKNGKLHGTSQNYYENDNLKHQAFYELGRQQGEVLGYHPNKKLKSKATFRDGQLHGPFATFYEKGTAATRGEYHNGLPVGEWKWYREDGKTILATSKFKNGTGVMHEFHENTKPKSETHFVNGVKSGKASTWHRNGNLQKETVWKNGLLNGPYREYTESGILMVEGHFINGRRHGDYKTWFGNKQERIKLSYHDDQLEGEAAEWYENGQVKSRGKWVDGMRDGRWVWYDRYGDALFNMTYNRGIVVGVEGQSASDMATEKASR